MEKTWSYRELELREEIAQRIQDELEKMLPPVDDAEYAVFNAMEWVIKLVRGEVWDTGPLKKVGLKAVPLMAGVLH